MASTITPKGWSSFQHYTNRNPPWIKLHKSLLDNFEFQCLPVASRALAPMLWLLASEFQDGAIPLDPAKLAFRLRLSEAELNDALKPLISEGFFECYHNASAALAPCKPGAMLEKEKEKEKEGEKNGEATASPTPKPKKPRRTSVQVLADFRDETKAVVNALMPEWRKEQPNGDPIDARTGDFAQAVESIFSLNCEWFTVDILTLAGKLYLAEKIKFYRAPQHFFSTAEKDENKWPWIGSARMAYRKLHPKAAPAPAEGSLTGEEVDGTNG